MHFTTIGDTGGTAVLFTHGWARDHRDFIPTAEALAPIARSYLVDLPGFGETPRPDGVWDTGAYADHALAFMRDQGVSRFVWVGHSFGGRMGLRAGVRAPQSLIGMVLAASAGIPRNRKPQDVWRGKLRQNIFKFKRDMAKTQAERDALERQYGSADYIHSGEINMRDIFLETIREDQTADLGRINVPTEMIYGARDTDTPPEVGQRIAAAICAGGGQGRYVELPELDHHTVLSRGHHQIALAVKTMIEKEAAR
ncbi:alpha/beta fold hydrolase [Albirhodobacter sp. R86504]|uniref:alpha/beta fold hydrolase n=1 Tax=Albirhodobacter sp. R86504 TaxID=3093848 RepID=UPI00366C5C79